MALVVIERGVMAGQHSAFEYRVRGARRRSIYVPSDLKHYKFGKQGEYTK